MARHAKDNRDDVRRAAADASSLMRARTAARRSEAKTNGSQNRFDEQATRPNAQSASKGRTDRTSSTLPRVSQPAKAKARHSRKPKPPTIVEFASQNAIYIVGVAAVAAIAAILLITIRSCVPTVTYDYDGELDFSYESPFNWDDLNTENEHYTYTSDGTVQSRWGIDVSDSQGEIDWKAVKSDGVEFAIIRLGYRGATKGDLYLDPLFESNLKGAQAAGIDCGVYFFSQAINEKEAKEEADFIIKALDGAELAYPVAFDFEEAVADVETPRAANLGKDMMTKIAKAFCARIEKAGYRSMIYGNYYDLNLYHYDSLTKHHIWWAEYDVTAANPHLDIDMWQYTSIGTVNGVDTPVDMNLDLTGVLAQ